MTTARPNPAAFTLIELIMVLAILAIVAGAIAPQLRAFAAGRSGNDAATLIVSLTNYARSQAAAEGKTYRLNFDPNGTTVYLTEDDGSGTYAAPANDYGRRFDLANDVRVATDLTKQPDGVYVAFRPNGRTDPATIHVTDKLGNTQDVAAASATELFRIVPAGGKR